MPGKLNRIRKYKNKKRAKKHGFRKRMRTTAGKKVISERRAKGRDSLSVEVKRSS